MNQDELDRVFKALSDPTRRGILEALAHGESNVKTLAAPFDMSQPAVSKHLRVLEEAGLVRREKQGREVRVRVDPRPIASAETWIGHYARVWRRQFDAVEHYLKMKALDAESDPGSPDAESEEEAP
ncbi:MAG: metalloregulator ArsR/SmtB family transcription factor [Acidobacteriota bacterium]